MPLSILIVDDEEPVREAIRSALEEQGYKVTECGGGDEVLPILETANFDLIISDIRMPGGDGISMLKMLKKSDYSEVPVLFISGFNDYTNDELRKMGADGFIDKPLAINVLLKHVKNFEDSKS